MSPTFWRAPGASSDERRAPLLAKSAMDYQRTTQAPNIALQGLSLPNRDMECETRAALWAARTCEEPPRHPTGPTNNTSGDPRRAAAMPHTHTVMNTDNRAHTYPRAPESSVTFG